MRSNQYNPDLTPGDLRIERRQRPITDEEIKGKSSFPGPDNNRHIDAFIKTTKH
jgi:hypothetical protein